MHIKSKLEINFVHIAILAICTMIGAVQTFNAGIIVVLLSVISFLISNLVCLIFLKSSSKHIKVFITAFVSSLVVVVFEMMAENGIVESIGNLSYFSILSSLVLSIDSIYIDNKAKSKGYLMKSLRLSLVYFLVFISYIVIKELLSFGTIAGTQIFKGYEGYEFFRTITFDLIVMGILCALFSQIVLTFVDLINERNLVYRKYKAKIRDEKIFIYEHYRRNKLLVSDVVINKVSAQNFDEDVEIEDKDEEDDSDKKEKTKEVRKSKILHKPRNNNKLKVSKEAKVEKLFDRSSGNNEEGEGNV